MEVAASQEVLSEKAQWLEGGGSGIEGRGADAPAATWGRRCGIGPQMRGRGLGEGEWELGRSAELVTKQGYQVDTHIVLLMSRVSSVPLLPNARIFAPPLISISDSLWAMVSAPEQPHAPPLRPRAAHVARSHHHSARSTHARSPLPPSQPSPPRRRCPSTQGPAWPSLRARRRCELLFDFRASLTC
jgi:hypothetical protein